MIIQTQTPSIRPITTAHLAQTMTLMGLTSIELKQKIDGALASNPALELVQERYCPTCNRPLLDSGPCPVCSRPKGLESDQPIVYVSPRDDFYTPRATGKYEDYPEEDFTAEVEDLPTYVLRQIAPDLPKDDRLLAAHILTGLDDDGLLRQPLIEIARYHHVPISRVESVIRLIQRADPVGVGSTSPQEALLVQVEVLSENQKIPPFTYEVIQKGMELLIKRQYSGLAHLLGISTSKVKTITQFISENLNPYPARAHWGDVHQSAEPVQEVYYYPDVIISLLNDSADSPLVVEVVSPLAGKLRISPLFRQSLREAPADKVEEWQSDLEQASLLVKCLQQRNHTIVRLMQMLAVIQRKFILEGDTYLEPTTRASLADELGVHESTISRAVSSKAVQLPNGRIIPLSKLFDRSLHIRATLRQIISEEAKPLTDTQLAGILKTKGYPVARRTVAKYRAMEGILPAHMRMQLSA